MHSEIVCKVFHSTLSLSGKISLILKEKKQKRTVAIQKQKEVKKKQQRIPIKGVGTGCQAWQCELCEKIFSTRKRAEQHIQDDH